jgi:C-terminal peptidase prc
LEEELKDPKGLSTEKQRELLRIAREKLGKREDLDEDKDVDIALTMIAASLNDPYTVYYDKEMVKKEESKLRAQFSGVGIHIRRDLARDGLLVVSPIKNSPAYKAGIKAGDLIIEVRREVDPTGKPFTSEADKVISTRGMKTEDALGIILGKPGVPVTLVIEREGAEKPLSFEIERGRVSLETVLGVKRDTKDDWNYWLDEENRIAYIYLSQFGPNTFGELKRTVERLQRLGMKGMVLDLRYNPGGLLGASLMIADMFVEDGLLLEVKPRVGRPERHYDQGFGQFTGFPMTVLVNGSSASASEIVSSVLQDYGRAVVIGERSYGKGSVQTVEKFDPTGGEFKMTTAKYFPPLGRNIDKLTSGGKPEDEWGVAPDKGYEIKLSREEKQELADLLRDKELIDRRDKPEKAEKKPFKDKQLETALEYLRTKAGVKTAKKPG